MGLLASMSLPAGVVTQVYLCPASTEVSANLNLCNRGADCEVRIAVTSGGAPTDASWIEYGYVLPQGEAMERTGLLLSAGEAIYAYASTGTVSVNLIGPKSAV